MWFIEYKAQESILTAQTNNTQKILLWENNYKIVQDFKIQSELKYKMINLRVVHTGI